MSEDDEGRDYTLTQNDLYDVANAIRSSYNCAMEHVRTLAQYCNLTDKETLEAIERMDDMMADMFHKRWTELETLGLNHYGDRNVGSMPLAKELVKVPPANTSFDMFIDAITGASNG